MGDGNWPTTLVIARVCGYVPEATYGGVGDAVCLKICTALNCSCGDCVSTASDVPLLFHVFTLHLAEELRGELESVSKDSSWSIATASHSLVSFRHTFGTTTCVHVCGQYL